MKKFLPFLGFAVFFTACNSAPKIDSASAQTAAVQPASQVMDTAGLAAYHQWKAQNELVNEEVEPQASPVVYTKPALSRKRTATAPRPVAARQSSTLEEIERSSSTRDNSSSTSTSSSDNSTAGTGSGTTAGTGAGTGETKAEEKKGPSSAVKGAVIGGVAGAAGGAVINKKNRVVGAVIGGVIGAAAGYGLGKAKDKKDASQ